jgi:hypothetical protein
MSVELYSGSRPIELGTVINLVHTRISRVSEINMVGARGAGREDLGSLSTKFDLEGGFFDSSALNNLQQLDRWRMIGISLKLLNPYKNTVVFINSVSPKVYFPSNVQYALNLVESKFKSLSTCDSLTNWQEEIAGTLTLEDTDPEPREGYYCIQDTAIAQTQAVINYTSTDDLDFTYYNYIAVDFRIDNLDNVTYIELCFVDSDGNTNYFDFTSEITLVDTWYRMIIHKTEFVEPSEAVDWSIIKNFYVYVEASSPGNYIITIDDFGVYE